MIVKDTQGAVRLLISKCDGTLTDQEGKKKKVATTNAQDQRFREGVLRESIASRVRVHGVKIATKPSR